PQVRLEELPDTELRQSAIEGWWVERQWDADTSPAITLTRPDYSLATRRYSFSSWSPAPWNAQIQLPNFKQDSGGRILA
ncbi:hypothetical protein, partial [Salmonella sp. SAL4438]|uniref:hypothetical protein n=1 Tax=Salmonella sp. SAL4438 TaxID=3159893 RepID=UPI00397C6872